MRQSDVPKAVGEKVRKGSVADLKRAERFNTAFIGVDRKAIIGSPGVSKSSVQRALNGQSLRKGTFFAIAAALGVNPEWLMSGTGEMRHDKPTIAVGSPPLDAASQTHGRLRLPGDPVQAIDILMGLAEYDRWEVPGGILDIQRLGDAIEMAERGNPSLADLRKEGQLDKSMAFIHANNVLLFYKSLTRQAATTLAAANVKKDL